MVKTRRQWQQTKTKSAESGTESESDTESGSELKENDVDETFNKNIKSFLKNYHLVFGKNAVEWGTIESLMFILNSSWAEVCLTS